MFERYLAKLKDIRYCAEKGARVLVRIDINSPIGRRGEVLDDFRIQRHSKTLRWLAEQGARVVAMSHQGRPGQDDFTSLEKHRDLLEKYMGMEVKFVDDVMGPAAREAIKSLAPGEVLLLDNTRFISEEIIERKLELQTETHLVKKLAPLFNYFVFDGFAVAHRAQPSVVGFPQVLPSCMGMVLEDELRALAEIEKAGGSAVLVAGGAKIPETLRLVGEALEKKLFGKVLTGGLLGLVFIAARHGFVTPALKSTLESYGLLSYVDQARRIMEKWGSCIEIPVDVAIDIEGERIEVDVFSISGEVKDVGSSSVRAFADALRAFDVAVFTGPLGYIESEAFTKASAALLDEAVELNKKVIIGGGHTVALARRIGVLERVFHASTGGRAFLEALVYGDLPALRALEISAEKFWGGDR